MMKRIFMSVVMATALCSVDVSAKSYYQSVEQGLVGVGKNIEAINFPIIGKLLPCAIIGASLRECPFQTLAVLAGLLGYVLAHNEMVQDKISQSGLLDTLGFKRSKQIPADIDDTLFYFEGDDTDDAEDDVLAEDEMLFSPDDNKNKSVVKKNPDRCVPEKF
jgi:hypothetical protein